MKDNENDNDFNQLEDTDIRIVIIYYCFSIIKLTTYHFYAIENLTSFMKFNNLKLFCFIEIGHI